VHRAAHRLHHADRLVPDGQRQVDASIGKAESGAAAEVEMAFADVHVGMAHAAMAEPQQHFVRAGRRRVTQPPLQRPAPFGNVVAEHAGPFGVR
jgi:hypothetical protein